MDIVTLGAALNGSAEYVNSHFKGGSNIQIVDNPDGTQTINASGEVSAEDTVARAEIAEIKDGETLDSFGDVETALGDKADTSTTYTKTDVDTALSGKQDALSAEQLSAVNSGITSAAVVQITTNKNDISSEQAKTTGMTEGGSNYITVNGIRVYVSATAPTGNIPDGSVGVGW